MSTPAAMCPMCGLRRAEMMVCDTCLTPVVETVGNGGLDNLETKYESRIVRCQGPTCYLCGGAPSVHTDHIVPRATGGSDHWSNVAGACERCNLAKHATEGITAEQASRAAEHQAAVRHAFERVVTGDLIWFQWFASEIQMMRDELEDDPESMDEEDVEFNLDPEAFWEEFPTAPEEIIDRVVQCVMEPNAITEFVMGASDRRPRVVDVSIHGDAEARSETVERLVTLETLHRDGLITSDEYAAKRHEIIDTL